MNQTALIVDDSPDIRLVVRSYLEQWPVDITEAPCGAAAIQAFRDNEFNLVFVDLVMPGMDGPELIRELRSIESSTQRRRSTVVVLSGSFDRSDWSRAFEAGMDHKLSKPISMKELTDLMTDLGLEECP